MILHSLCSFLFSRSFFISSKAYAQSKLAQILFTIHLEKLLREKNSRVHLLSVHPGVVDTDIFNGTALKIIFPWVLKYICKVMLYKYFGS